MSNGEGTYPADDNSNGQFYTKNEKYLEVSANVSNYKPGSGYSITVVKNG